MRLSTQAQSSPAVLLRPRLYLTGTAVQRPGPVQAARGRGTRFRRGICTAGYLSRTEDICYADPLKDFFTMLRLARIGEHMTLQVLPGEFSVCKVVDMAAVDFTASWLFVGKTDAELSVVCLREDAPQQYEAREDGWRAFRVAGQMDFSLTGVLAGLSAVLAQAGISIFAVSTFDTDYVLVKQDRLVAALAALESAGYGLEAVSD